MPVSMRAAAIDRFGPPSVLKVRRLPVPSIGADEVLLAVQTAGVGIWDTYLRDGSWAEGRPRFPRSLGTDGAGVIAAVGARVRRLNIGDRVWAYQYDTPKGGFYAEFVAVKASNAARYPRRLASKQAGAGAVTGLTALQGIDDALKVRRGETVLVFGASGAVGALAVQFARQRGAWVIGSASGGQAAALVRRLGAQAVFDPRAPDAVDRLRALAPEAIDAVLALAGSPVLDRCLSLVKRGGRLAYPNGIEPQPRRRRGLRVFPYDVEVGPRPWVRLGRAIERAGLRVPVAATFPLGGAARAHQRLQKGHVAGRIVIQVSRRR